MKYVAIVFAVLCVIAFMLDLWVIFITLQVIGVPSLHSWTIPLHERPHAVRQYRVELAGLVVLPLAFALSVWTLNTSARRKNA